MQTRVESEQIRLACTLGAHLQRFLDPLLVELDEHLDRRLVRTFAGAIAAILRFRHPRCGLLALGIGRLSHLAPARAGRDQTPLHLLRSGRWSAEQMDDSLWSSATPLWLVISRPGQGHEPWYLLSTEPLDRGADAWRVVFAYARPWQIEMAFRFTKSELALER